MQPISDAWRAAMATGWQIVNKVQILSGGAPVDVGPITVSSVQLSVSRTAANRRSLQLTILCDEAGTGLIPAADNTGPLTPFGNELQVLSGWINPATSSPEYVPVGVFTIETVTVTDNGTTLALTVTTYDRSYTMGLYAFLSAYSIAAATRGDTALSALVTDRLGAAIPQNIVPAYSATGTALTVPAVTFNEGSNPWTSGQSGIAAPIGYDIFFDPTGTFVGRPIPDPKTAPVAWSYIDGDKNLLSAVSRSLTRSGVSNDFIVTGSGTGVATPVAGEASVTDQASPMYIGGPFGDVPTFTNSSTVTTADQASFAATNQLAAALGQVETISLTVAPNPALDVDDVVFVYRPRAGIDGYYVLDTITSTLAPYGTSVLTGRRIR